MSVETVTALFAVLALLVGGATILAWAVAVRARRNPDRLQAWTERRAIEVPNLLLVAGLIGLGMMAGSLYLSEVAGFPPCRLCWYQRIAAYPLGPMVLLAWYRRDGGIRPYGLLLAAVGGLISLYHILVERFPQLETGACEVNNPCSIRWVERFGFVTIPTMALIGFIAIGSALMFIPKETPT